MNFIDRSEAGRKLGIRLLIGPYLHQIDPSDLLVLSIPRGGVQVGAAIAEILRCPHDVVVVKKIGFPGQPELAIGAAAEDGIVLLDSVLGAWCQLDQAQIERASEAALDRVEHYARLFRGQRRLDLTGKTVILTDDGVATSSTVKAALRWLISDRHSAQPTRLILAVPVCSPKAAHELETLVDHLVCLTIPDDFYAVGQFYQNFRQVSDEEVLAILAADVGQEAI